MPYKDKEKERQNRKKYYRKNKEKILKKMRLYGKKWYQKNKERVQLQHREWYQKNKEKRAQYHKKYNQENKEKVSQRGKKYYQKNIERIRKRNRKYNQKNKEKRLQYKGIWQKYRRKTNPRYRLDENMGTAIWTSLKDKKAGRKWETLVDYSLRELIEYLEKRFDSKMNWNNYGSYWAIDHIKPRSLFNYTSPDGLEFKQCWALCNLQPLWAEENLRKGGKWEQ